MNRTLQLCFAVLCVASVATAQNSSIAEVKRLFDAGAEAYEAGQYSVAIQAFEQAYALSPRPGIVFSLAQAYRRQYFVELTPALLRRAIECNRDYLRMVERGGRRADAAEALAELELLASRLEPAPSSSIIAQKSPTRLMVTSPAERATVKLDGALPVDCPFIAKVGAGQHSIRVLAPGYEEQQREVTAVEGALVVVDVSLREKAASLQVEGDPSAEIIVDGKLIGLTPFSSHVQIPPGDHWLSVRKLGYISAEIRSTLRRGETRTLSYRLVPTGQRSASYVAMGAGVVSIAAAGIFAGLSLHAQSEASQISRERGDENISTARLVEYFRAIDRRNDYRTASFVGTGMGLGLGLVGVGLYSIDSPRRSSASSLPAQLSLLSQSESDTCLFLLPVVGTALSGMMLEIRY